MFCFTDPCLQFNIGVLIALSGDIESHPGPASSQNKFHFVVSFLKCYDENKVKCPTIWQHTVYTVFNIDGELAPFLIVVCSKYVSD